MSKLWFVGREDAPFWESESLARFGVFDHEAVFETATLETKGSVGYDLFSIRMQQALLQDSDI